MDRKKHILIFLVICLTACNLPIQAPSSTPTPDVSALQTQTVATVYAQAAVPTPTVALTAALTDAPKVHFAGDTNCRTGPGIKFALVTTIKEGQSAQLAGQPEQGDYWIVMDPNGSGPCWVVRDFATPDGNTAPLARMTAPPTYTPMPRPETPILADWSFSCEYASANSQDLATVTVELKWRDMSEYELGYEVYRNNELLASLPQNTTAYTDIAYLAYGQGATYVIEAWNYDSIARSKEAKVECK